jgi:DNA-directed RNA polymerase beta subunit
MARHPAGVFRTGSFALSGSVPRPERETHLATVNKPIVSFGKLVAGMDHPNLLDVQLRAFETLLQTDAAAREREDVGLERVFNEIFPISDVNGNFSLEYVRYALASPSTTWRSAWSAT